MKITVNNDNDRDYEALFDDLIQEVFGFSFEPWLEHKLWDERYESYSIISDNKMLSNLCIFKTDMIVQGQEVKANQFGAVCTRKSEQGKGLSRLLMEHVLNIYKDTPAFLFSNESVIDFYPRFGFKQIQTYRPIIETTIYNDPGTAKKLTATDPIVKNIIYNRTGNSKTFDCLNTASIQMFHMLMGYPGDIYSLPTLETIIIAQQNDTELFIADIISIKPITFEKIKTELPFRGIEEVEFGFNPDWLEVTPTWEPVDKNEVMFFTKGDLNPPKNFRFPTTSVT